MRHNESASWSQPNLARLRQNLLGTFNRSELRDLCFDLNVNPEELPWEVNSDLVRALLLHLAHNDSLEVLLPKLRQIRPHIEWPDISEDELAILRRTQLTPTPLSAKERQEKRLLNRLLAKVKNDWINKYLEQSTREIGLMDLPQQRIDELIAHPWHEVLETAVYDIESAASSQTVLNTYYETNQALLILGGPGSGKTTVLLQLARSLIALAEQDPLQSIPIYLHLSSWEEQRQTFSDWVVTELGRKYFVPEKFGRRWLKNDKFILLLDSLDEVSAKYRGHSIEAINQFRTERGFTGLAICCREEAYKETEARLRVDGAILLQKLTSEQINDFLAQAGPNLASLRKALQQDNMLRQMAQSPLMLNMMLLAYSNYEGDIVSPDDNNQEALSARRHHLFATYVQRRLSSRGEGDYAAAQIQTWLTWLAQKMTAHHQSQFFIEQIQPSWLNSVSWYWLYTIGSRLIGGGIISFILWFMLMRFDPVSFTPEPLRLLTASWPLPGNWLHAINLVLLNLILGLVVGVIDGLFFMRRHGQANEAEISPKQGWQHLSLVAFSILVTTFILFTLFSSSPNYTVALFAGLFEAVFFTVGFGYISHGQSLRTEIRTIEALTWSWTGAARGIILGLFLGLLAGFSIHILYQFPPTSVSVGVGFGLFFALFGGLQHNQLPKTSRPNQGIWLSLKNGLLAALVFGSTLGIAIGGTLFIGFKWTGNPFSFILTYVLVFGLAAGLLYGLIDVLKHFVVRLLLWATGGMPWRYAHFLDDAARRILLYKVGGGYQFAHRLLQDYFVAPNKAGTGSAEWDDM